MAGMNRVRSVSSARRVVALVMLPVAALVSLGVFSMVQAQAQTAPTPSYATAQQQWQGAYDHAEAQAPKPLLPAADRPTYVQDFQSFANCMQAHGITDFPNAVSTLGDGKTPEPLIGGPPGSDLDPSSSAYQSATAACPFTSHVPASDFEPQPTPTNQPAPATGN